MIICWIVLFISHTTSFSLENELYQNISRLHEEFLEQVQEKWTNLTYILENTGKLKINYGYGISTQSS
ncbi:immunity protein YezG family protein [Fictibacillus phosphorivorans]|uniref:immunity protein YezG family protein n=1 Tax=Fictibacillus phosphorivorans TaxID=1221500 RepID=UPI0011A17497|nr:immunity protein YezG family protein [Fictibacillus phosphorivorans]